MIQNTLYKKLFLSPYYFTIAIRKKDHSILEQTTFQAEYVLPGKPGCWSADPMLAQWEGRTWLFYEAVHGEKGRIEVAEVREDCTISEPTVLLEDSCHYSYPFVFRLDHHWYMIPESSASGEVRLYETENFPYDWKKKQVLLQESDVDTTLLWTKDGPVLLTYVPAAGTERVRPKAFRLQPEGDRWQLQPLSWERYDNLQCRGAGAGLYENGRLFRPAQVSQEERYGDAVKFFEVTATADHYDEMERTVLKPEAVFAEHCRFDGLHTYAETEQFAAIDLRCRRFDLLKLPKVLWHQLRERCSHAN